MKVFPDDLLYSREHVWVRVEGNLATIGITDYAQERLGEILSLDGMRQVRREEEISSIEQARAFGRALRDEGMELIREAYEKLGIRDEG